MADMKEIKISGTMGERYLTKFTRAFEQLQKAGPGGGGFNEKTLKGMERALKPIVKQFQSMGLDVTKVAKTLTTDWKKGLEQANKSTKSMSDMFKKQLVDAQNIGRAVKHYSSDVNKAQYVANAMNRGGTQFDRDLYGSQAEARWEHKAQQVMGLSQANQVTTLEAGQAYASAELERKEQQKQQRMSNIFRASQFAQMGISMVGGAVQGYLGMAGREQANLAGQRGFSRDLYNQVSSGSIEGARSIRALMRSGPQLAQIAENARDSSVVGSGTQIGVGVAKAGGGAVLAGTGAAGAYAGAGLIGGGIGDVGGGLMDLITGKAGAAEAEAARSAIANARVLDDPRFHRSLEFVHARSRDFNRRGKLGMGGLTDMGAMASMGLVGGQTPDEMQALQDRIGGIAGYGKKLKSGVSESALVTGLASLGQSYGLSAETGASYLGAQMTTSKGGLDYAKTRKEFEEMLGRGVALGFKDQGVKQAMTDWMTTSLIGGNTMRSGSSSGLQDLVSMGLRGNPLADSVETQKRAIGGVQELNSFMGSGQGYYGARGFQIAGNALRSVRGATALTQSALGKTSLEDMVNPDSTMMRLAFEGTGLSQEGRAGKIGEIVRGRLGDVISDNPVVRERMETIRREMQRENGGKPVADKDVFARLYRSDKSEDKRARAQMALGAFETGQFSKIEGAEAAMTAALGAAAQISPDQVKVDIKKQALDREKDAGEKYDEGRLKAMAVEVKQAATVFAGSIAEVGAGFSALQEISLKLGDQSPAQIIKEANAELQSLAETVRSLGIAAKGARAG